MRLKNAVAVKPSCHTKLVRPGTVSMPCPASDMVDIEPVSDILNVALPFRTAVRFPCARVDVRLSPATSSRWSSPQRVLDFWSSPGQVRVELHSALTGVRNSLTVAEPSTQNMHA